MMIPYQEPRITWDHFSRLLYCLCSLFYHLINGQRPTTRVYARDVEIGIRRQIVIFPLSTSVSANMELVNLRDRRMHIWMSRTSVQYSYKHGSM